MWEYAAYQDMFNRMQVMQLGSDLAAFPPAPACFPPYPPLVSVPQSYTQEEEGEEDDGDNEEDDDDADIDDE